MNFNQLWESYKRGFGDLNGTQSTDFSLIFLLKLSIIKQLLVKSNLNISHPAGEFWLGLENIHSLSKQREYVLQVEVTDGAGQQEAARYQFQLDGEEKMFSLHLQPESEGQESIMTTGASGLPFSTADRDNDLAEDVNCAELLSGKTAAPSPKHT